MWRFRIQNLVLSSLVILSLGCKPTGYLYPVQVEKQPCLANLEPSFSTVLYNAQVNVAGKHLSGIVLFKTMPDSSKRVIFTNEMGVTYFDYEFRKEGFRVVSSVKLMNKKVVINRLRNDLSLLLLHGFDLGNPDILASGNESYYAYSRAREQVYFITDAICSRLTRIETASDKKKKIIVNLTGDGPGMPDSVYLAHQSFEYNITLKKIIR
ncbi:MAG: hypothetical protein M3Q95_00780 [Bacteroidota bacterium]|nr:hypothetical protein [Bacteroidota bacterium]